MRLRDFTTANVYQDFILEFKKKPVSPETSYYEYRIYWYNNTNLWADYVEVKDCYIDSLTAGKYDGRLDSIVHHYNTFPALFRYYLIDEPYYGQFAASGYIMKFLRRSPYNNEKPGVQAIGAGGKTFYQNYADSIKPNELLFDYYPFFGARYSYGRTPEDSGLLFQERLDSLCTQLSDIRSVARQETLDFWYIPQAFGKYDSATAITPDSGGNEGDWRLPTPRELRCGVWLGLAYGAKGIMYFRYKTRPTNESGFTEWMRALWRYDNSPREPLYSEAKNINVVLKEIGPLLLTLTSDTVFKASDGIPQGCFIKNLKIWNMQDTLIQIGTFHKTDNPDDKYFIIVNRHCLPSESLEVVVELEDTLRYLYDCYNKAIITYERMIGGPITYGYRVKLQPGQGRLFRMVPFTQEFRINQNQTYTNLPYVALRTKATSVLGVDSMKIWQYYIPQQETLRYCYSTGWIPYDTAYCWYLREDEGVNTVYIRYKIGGFCESPVYCDTIIFDKTAPTGSFVINDNNKFTNTPNVTIKNSMSDTRSGMAKMRFGNRYLKNLVKNSSFDGTGFWEMDTAIYHDSLKLFEIPVQTAGNYFYQSIPPESLSAFDNDTMLLWIDLVSDGFAGAGKIQFQYIYGIPPDTIIDPRGTQPYGTSITIPQGTNARVSHYNLYSYFKYHPEPPPGKVLLEARVGVFVEAGSQNSGRLFIDNLRLDVVGPYNDYSKFENYDSLKFWVLTSGNGVKKVYSQFSDGSGNETEILFDSIIVDTTRPARHISSPQNGQTISGTVTITGYAYDYADPQQHFKLYELKYMKNTDPAQHWYGIHPESLFYTPKNPTIPPRTLASWDTREVTNNHGNGWYYLRLAVQDLANNYRDTIINVRINNPIDIGGEISGFSNYLYGLSAGGDIYIGEFGTGNVYRYDNNYQLLGTFQIIDSLGIGFPVAIQIDNSGKLWIANIISQTINRFSLQGNFEFRFGGNLSLPSGIAFDNAGNIWVSDRLHHKIKKFDSSGNLLFEFGTKGSNYGEIDRPIGIGINGEKIYVADSRNKRISIFDTTGNFIGVIGDSAGLLLPFGLVLDSSGCLFVSDFLGNQVLEFDPYGNPLLEIDSILDAPSGLALSEDEKTLYVSDTKHKRVLAFVVRDEPPDSTGGGPMGGESQILRRFYLEKIYPNPFKEKVIIRYMIHDTGYRIPDISLKIYDVSGRMIKSFNLESCIVNQVSAVVWDGTDDYGRKLPSGVYFIRLETEEFRKTEKVILLR